ncbi:MAG TPA: hypothetical protein VE053_13910 [Allosphingosinicella sp.]|nr:hypothetical protein [Allosphingosinicella sp.]
MRDEIDGRIWVQHGHAFSQDVANFFAAVRASVGSALKRLNEIEFDAPWKRDLRGPGQA